MAGSADQTAALSQRCDSWAVADCCSAGHEKVFDARSSKRRAERYRRHGLRRPTRRIIDVVTSLGLADATILEVGGGVGELHIELLERGARHAVNLELSPAYEAEAQRLLDEHGASDRVQRRLLDIAVRPDDVEPADIVVLHKVVCCYPDYVALLSAAASKARRHLVFSYPTRQPLRQAEFALENLQHRINGNDFRVFVHPPRAMLGVLAEHGLRVIAKSRSPVWSIVATGR